MEKHLKSRNIEDEFEEFCGVQIIMLFLVVCLKKYIYLNPRTRRHNYTHQK
jgi:hypothetical protein